MIEQYNKKMKFTIIADVSGSMNSDCGKSVGKENTYSKIKVLQHTIKTIARMIVGHELKIITFNDRSYVFMEMRTVNHEVIRMLDNEQMIPEGGTIFIRAFKELIKEECDEVIFLTDGQDTTYVNTLTDDIINVVRNYNARIHCVGLSMDRELNTEILVKISDFKDGFYCYCPDISMVGSVFIHLIGNIIINEQGEEFPEYEKFMGVLEYIASNYQKPSDVTFIDEVLTNDIESPNPNKGQVMKSIPNWDEWGRHYLPSFIKAHDKKVCTNFKDESLKRYITPRMKEFIENAEEIFKSIPPPVNNNNIVIAGEFNKYAMCASSGCFGSDTLIVCEGGVAKINELKNGTNIKTNNGYSKLKYIVVSPPTKMLLVDDSFWITPTHPLFINKWVHPNTLNTSKEAVKECYNLVLEENGIIFIHPNYMTVNFGHNLKGDVVEHDYFGSDEVIKYLDSLDDGTGIVRVDKFMKI